MNDAIAEALSAGRTLIVPSRQRAAALAQSWARARSAAGEAVWQTPEILTFDAWLAREWLRARNAGRLARPLQLLNTAQERRLWAQVLAEMEAAGSPWGELPLHAASLMRSATRARRTRVDLAKPGIAAEHRLLALALDEIDRRCARNGWLVPGLARPGDLEGLAPTAPVFAGFADLPALASCLTGSLPRQLALPRSRSETRLHAAPDARGEALAAGQWCRQLLEQQPRRRLLVVHRGSELSLAQVGGLVWSRLAAGTRAGRGEAPDPGLLGIEGGTPLLEQGLFADALAVLSVLAEPVGLETISTLLLSPHFNALPQQSAVSLEVALRRVTRRGLDLAGLRALLQRMDARVPGAARLAGTLTEISSLSQGGQAAGAATWASRFDLVLRRLGFPGPLPLDSREAQRLSRWRELLDEFATLEAFSPHLSAHEALATLEQLARHGRHEAAGLDASITLTADGGDPLADYDGIWVMGLTQARWPEPPRPDAFVPLAEQLRAGWPEASVALRAKQARFELAAWQARTPRLVLSFGRYVGDVEQLPSMLLAGFAATEDAGPTAVPAVAVLQAIADEQLPALAAPGAVVPLPRGVRSIELQHACPFRSQAELRLGALALEYPPEGIDARLRGDLLHAALQQLWARIPDSATLQGLDETSRSRLCAEAWDLAQVGVTGRMPLPPPPRALARERSRGLHLLSGLLEFEASRPPFRVHQREAPIQAAFGGPTLRLRVDRTDAFTDGSRRVIDYKTGANARANFDTDPPQPVQLAVYAAAMAEAGEPPEALALLSVSSRALRFNGGGKPGTEAAAGLEEIAGWDVRLARWTAIVTALAGAQVAGVACVAPLKGACNTCHLEGFCRIGISPERDDE